MSKNILYTYRNNNELRNYQQQLEKADKYVYSFIIAENEKLLNDTDNIVIDITSVVLFLNANMGNRLSAEVTLHNLDDDVTVIIQSSYADIALSIFPYIFDTIEPLFDEQKNEIIIKAIERKSVFTYTDSNALSIIIEYSNKNEIPLASFPTANGELKNNFDYFNKMDKLALIDLTTLVQAILDNRNILYLTEQFFGKARDLLEYFPLFFNKAEPIKELLKDIELSEKTEAVETAGQKRLITDYSDEEFEKFCNYFDKNLIGHNTFKKRFFRALSNFRILNRVNDQKVFSVFLFGISGIGKTEVARLVANQLFEDAYLTKINFANYSGQDALNILIGSPPGYVGYGHGELSEKIQKSQVGLILCDEFEKTTRPVHSFFLELLEDGKFTDAIPEEHNVNGYIVIFTSNILSEADYKKIMPPELQTRFDIVCEFREPSKEEKLDFLDFLFEKAEINYGMEFRNYNVSKTDKKLLYNFNYAGYSALRDIKREFQNRLIDLFEERRLGM